MSAQWGLEQARLVLLAPAGELIAITTTERSLWPPILF